MDLRWDILAGYGPLFVAGLWMTIKLTIVAIGSTHGGSAQLLYRSIRRLLDGLPADTVLMAPDDLAATPLDGAAAEIEVLEDGDDAQRVHVAAQGAGVLVIADAVQDGWRALVDGERADLLTVDGAVRGVAVPAGEHEVELRYVPPGRSVLAPVAALAALAWLTAAVTLVARDRRGRDRDRDGEPAPGRSTDSEASA